MPLRPIDQAIDDLRKVADPIARIREADGLDSALAEARTAVAQIRRDAVTALRTPTSGYGSIAQQLKLFLSSIEITKALISCALHTPLFSSSS